MIGFLRTSLLLLFLGYGCATALGQSAATPSYMGSASCENCHETETSTWQNSHHSKAWMKPDAETVDGNFDDAVFNHRGRKTRFFHTDDGYFIETTDITDGPKTYRVVGVGGIAPLQQYLIETEPGRLQSLDVVWDQEKETWYHLYPAQVLEPNDGFHWSGPYKNWNARCAECHSTGFEKNYSLRIRRYESSQVETGIGCEACHGPGEAHVSWAEGTPSSAKSQYPGLSDKGLVLEFSENNPETEIQQCAGCHSRREPFQNGSPLPGTPFHDSYRLALLRDGLYHPDGQILDEVYVYGSFLQSKMYAKGVRCSNCHDPHSVNLRAEGNEICTQCHSLAGNSSFPTLAAKSYDDPSHHFHEMETTGAQCVSCHMIERTYMGIDGRRDHSFRVPRPDLSAKIDTPNACIDCHQDKTADWAAQELKTRFPDSENRKEHFGVSFAAARNGANDLGEDLLEIALQVTFPAIVRASALDLLAPQADSDLADRASVLLNDSDPLVRVAAVAIQERVDGPEKTQRIVQALQDPIKSVRIAAARQLLTMNRGQLPETAVEPAGDASREWQASLAAKSDFPETHMVLGGAALAMRNANAAISAFQEVTVLDPQLVQAWIFLVRLHWSQGNMAAVEFTLQKGLAANPDDPNLLELKRQVLAR